jgi:hypothetical protein
MPLTFAAITKSLRVRPDAACVVVPSVDVDLPGFGVDYCGFHTRTNINGIVVQVLLVGNPDRAPAQCKPQAVGPNGSSAADGMATILVNELFDAIVDPNFSAWYDRFGLEPADKCAWNFGTTYTATNGARANVRLGSETHAHATTIATNGATAVRFLTLKTRSPVDHATNAAHSSGTSNISATKRPS